MAAVIQPKKVLEFGADTPVVVSNLEGTATLADVIAKINEILTKLREYGYVS